MLDVAILYEEVFNRLAIRVTQYTCLPTSLHWKFAKEICGKLKLFNSITEVFFGTKYPTANEYFPKICQIKVALLQWIESSDELVKRMAENMLVKFEKYWRVVHKMMGIAAVLDPRYKTNLLEYYYGVFYGNDADFQVKSIRQVCYELLYDYQLKMNKDSRSESATLDANVDVYLEEEVLPRSPDFDILLWWKLNDIKYTTLQVIARDVLTIPVSTVASESAFSTNGHIISPHRSRLHWTTLEALMYARSWLWSPENNVNLKSTMGNEYAILLTEMESDDEGELLIDGATSISNSRLKDEDY
ncbi:unnamed protein product [Vicia faba]|uniref:Uncharacterized protein n=1 Tax=Vicia faba TaxID=3906 RepID=A0AAV0YN54_VICFA|nr:unnamed protein product [Vicia faba]